MKNLNLTIIGNVGVVKPLFETKNGARLLEVEVACSLATGTSVAGKKEYETVWYTCKKSFHSSVEIVDQDLVVKGARILVNGEFCIEEYADKDGVVQSKRVLNNASFFMEGFRAKKSKKQSK